MDTWGFLVILIFGVVWLVTRKKSNKWASFATLMVGVGAGIVVGAIGSYLIVSSLF